MSWSLSVSWWLTVPLAVLSGLLVIRIFIIFHDCGHGSYFKSPLANDIAGFISGMVTFTPYYHWRWEHGIHHGAAGHLDRRGTGDIRGSLKSLAFRLWDESRHKLVSFRHIRSKPRGKAPWS